MKKSTLIVLLLAIIARRRVLFSIGSPARKTPTRNDRRHFKAGLHVQAGRRRLDHHHSARRPGATADSVRKRNADWQITQPLATLRTMSTLAASRSALHCSHRRDGARHARPAESVRTRSRRRRRSTSRWRTATSTPSSSGKKDFVGTSVYSKIDSDKDVALLPESLLGLTGKSLARLAIKRASRSHTDQISSIDLKNASGEMVASKDGQTWKFSKPSAAFADSCCCR